MDVDTPMTPTPTVRSATNVPRTGPSPMPPAAAATTLETAPATTPVSAPAPHGGTRLPPTLSSLPSEQTTSHDTSSQLEARRRPPTLRSRATRPQPSTRAVHPRSGTSIWRRQPGPQPRRSTGLSIVISTLQQLQRLLG
ncbi:platelet glycoprotein Ib alpha chain-like [Bactrocera oleae]|uniref:platelet glycoprotein Ib alpha chain-like n=1 Tax=Bactrocera oleae TaxID=104688 RepID=UPI00387E63B4